MRDNHKKWVSHISYSFFLCLFFTNPTLSQGTWEFDSQDKNTYNQLLSLKTNSSSINLDRDRSSTKYLLHFNNSIKLLIADDQGQLGAYEKSTENILDHFKDQSEDSPYHKFYIAEVLLQSAFIHLNFGHEFTAGWELRRAYREINRNIKVYPDFVPQYKTIGLLNIIIGSVPDKYNWMLSIMGMEGSVKDGLNELERLSKSDNIFSTEGELLTLLMKGYVLQEIDSSVEGLEQFYRKDKSNLLAGYLYASVLMKNQQNELAIQTLSSINNQPNTGNISFPLLQYLLAEAYLHKGEYALAISQYDVFRKLHPGKNYIKDALYKTGLSYWLLNEPDSTTKYYKMADEFGASLTEADKHASKQLSSKSKLLKKIMEVRLLTDGGYYEKALEKLDNIRAAELKDKKNQIEYNYRKARVYHQMNQLNAAIAFYKLTINNVEKNDWYFAPNSALQLGFIYQAEENDYLAEKYFKLALSYKNHEYKNSIDNKAKSALSSMEK